MKKNDYLLTILVPVFNEERTLREILERTTTLQIEKYEVIVVDDASSDQSPQIISDFEENFSSKNVDLVTVRHSKNQGKGSAIQTATKLAQGRYFVIQDADLEYSPEDLPALLEHATSNKYPVVYGSRFLGDIKGMPRPNYHANKFYNFLLRRMYPTSITDMHTCYKMVRIDLMRKLKIESNGFGYATELVSKILRNNIRIQEAPISFSGRTKSDGKKIDVMDGVECTLKLVQLRFTRKHNLGDYETEF
jgi:glycosyltransferase involved in cell wall biosynthesis